MDGPVDPERALALLYVPRPRRARIELLWRLDATLGRIVATAREPALGAIRLAWWRDALAALDHAPPPGEPLLRAIAGQLLPCGLAGQVLAGLEHGWSALLDGEIDEAALDRHAVERGGRLFALAARLLGGDRAGLAARAGEGWALVDLARHLPDRDAAARALAAASARFAPGDARWPVALRPLGMLARLARRDARRPADRLPRQGSPRRLAALLGHRLTGAP